MGGREVREVVDSRYAENKSRWTRCGQCRKERHQDPYGEAQGGAWLGWTVDLV